jgi:hypothetical protein
MRKCNLRRLINYNYWDVVRDNIVNQDLREFCTDEKSQEYRNRSSYNICRQLMIIEFLKESCDLNLEKNNWRKKEEI